VFIPLVVFVLAILLVAEGAGLFGGAGRESTTRILTSIGSLFGGSSGEPPSDEPVESAPTVPSKVSLNVLITSQEEDGADLAVPVILSRLIETDVIATDTFQATGEAPAEEARAVGMITVVNETSNDYRFVATTRFLSSDGVLFRLENETSIPPNGTVDVEVYADEVGAAGDIGPSRFTIPGLSEDLQQYIYGRSRTAMSGGSGTVSAVKEDDLEEARKDLMSRLFSEARENFKSMVSAGEIVLADLITSRETDSILPEDGSEGATFEATLAVTFSALVVPDQQLVEMLEQKVAEDLAGQADPADYELGVPLYTVEAFDTTSGRAEIRVEAPVQRRR
jgi:hypothetical protein